MNKKILLANPRGFCAGVDRAIDIVEKAIEKFGSPIYVRHEVVHHFMSYINRGAKFFYGFLNDVYSSIDACAKTSGIGE